MSQGIASLHKVLKDETRQRIVLLLSEKGKLSYTELMNFLHIRSTGKMNYHLKILGNLILKDDYGSYMLSNKGKLATQLLKEFSENLPSKNVIQLSKRILLAGMAAYTLFSIIILTLYVQGVINLHILLLNEIISTSLLGVLMFRFAINRFGIRITITPYISLGRIGSVMFWALAGTSILFVGGGFFLYILQTFLQMIGIPLVLFPFRWWIIIGFTVGPLAGGYIGYLKFRNQQNHNLSC